MHFKNYYWKNGVPQGWQKVDFNQEPTTYKIVTDPYRKRFTVELYQMGRFHQIVYDSFFLDFRKLTPLEQTAWQKETLEETSKATKSLIRNGEDRVVLIEECSFADSFCKECRISSPHGLHLSTHRMFYTHQQDPINGVILFDSYDKLVMWKTYACNQEGEFTDLIEEQWDLGPQAVPPFTQGDPKRGLYGKNHF